MLVYILKHDVLVKLRKEKAWSQRKAAEQAEITLRTWQNAEHRKRVSSETTKLIAKALEVLPSEITDTIEIVDNNKSSNNTQQSKDAYENFLINTAQDAHGAIVNSLNHHLSRNWGTAELTPIISQILIRFGLDLIHLYGDLEVAKNFICAISEMSQKALELSQQDKEVLD